MEEPIKGSKQMFFALSQVSPMISRELFWALDVKAWLLPYSTVEDDSAITFYTTKP